MASLQYVGLITTIREHYAEFHKRVGKLPATAVNPLRIASMNKRCALILLMLTGISTACMADNEDSIPENTTVLPLGKVDLTLEYQKKACSMTLDLEYYQKVSVAQVKSTLQNDECAASWGSYVLRVHYLPDEGQRSTIEFEETWVRDNDNDVVTEKDYYIGEDLEIRRISAARLHCECTRPQSVEPSPNSKPLEHEDAE